MFGLLGFVHKESTVDHVLMRRGLLSGWSLHRLQSWPWPAVPDRRKALPKFCRQVRVDERELGTCERKRNDLDIWRRSHTSCHRAFERPSPSPLLMT